MSIKYATPMECRLLLQRAKNAHLNSLISSMECTSASPKGHWETKLSRWFSKTSVVTPRSYSRWVLNWLSLMHSTTFGKDLNMVKEKSATSTTNTAAQSAANGHQIGGSHYQSPIQHWDYVTANQIPYLEAQAIRYLTRWRKKDGMEDLFKARHFVEKLIETEMAKGRTERAQSGTADVIPEKASPVKPADVNDYAEKMAAAAAKDMERAAEMLSGLLSRGMPPISRVVVKNSGSPSGGVIAAAEMQIKRKRLTDNQVKAIEEMDDETVNFLHDEFTRW